MTGTTQAVIDNDAPISSAEADEKIADLLAQDPAALGIDMSDTPDGEEDGEAPQHATPGEQTANGEEGEEESEEVPSDDDDWDSASKEDDETNDEPEDPEGRGSRFVSDDGKVRLSDGRITTIAALKEGAFLQDDYNRSQAQLSQQAQQLNALQATLQQQYDHVDQQMQVAMQIANAFLPQMPDARLAAEDPLAYTTAKAEYDQMQVAAQQLMMQHQAMQDEQSQSKQQQDAAALGREVELFLLAEPKLRDPNAWQKFRDEALQVGQKHYGMQPEDIQHVTKGWMLRMMADAMRYRRMQSASGKAQRKVQGKPPKTVRKPGKRRTSGDRAQQYQNDLTTALKRTGRTAVADRLLETMVS